MPRTGFVVLYIHNETAYHRYRRGGAGAACGAGDGCCDDHAAEIVASGDQRFQKVEREPTGELVFKTKNKRIYSVLSWVEIYRHIRYFRCGAPCGREVFEKIGC